MQALSRRRLYIASIMMIGALVGVFGCSTAIGFICTIILFASIYPAIGLAARRAYLVSDRAIDGSETETEQAAVHEEGSAASDNEHNPSIKAELASMLFKLNAIPPFRAPPSRHLTTKPRRVCQRGKDFPLGTEIEARTRPIKIKRESENDAILGRVSRAAKTWEPAERAFDDQITRRVMSRARRKVDKAAKTVASTPTAVKTPRREDGENVEFEAGLPKLPKGWVYVFDEQ